MRVRDPQGDLAALRADLARYPRRALLREQSAWALVVYRFGRWADHRGGSTARIGNPLYWLTYRAVETLTGISLDKNVRMGPGCRIHHFGPIVVHDDAVIGANVTFRHGVTIGDRTPGGPVPVLEDDVEIGAFAQILGGVRIGQGATVGAMAVVLADVPPGGRAVGNPARILPPKADPGP